MSVRRAAVWSLTFPFPPPCPLASFVYLALATLTSLSKGASKGIAPFSPLGTRLTPSGGAASPVRRGPRDVRRYETRGT